MLTKFAVFSALLSLATMSSAADSSIERRGEAKIDIIPYKGAKVTHQDEQIDNIVDGTPSTFTFNNGGKQSFNWDIYEKDTGLSNHIYHLACTLEIAGYFTGAASFKLFNQTAGPHVEIDEGEIVDRSVVKFSCPEADAKCLSGYKATCDAMPHWDEEKGLGLFPTQIVKPN